MHELIELKEMLCGELEKYGEKELTAGSLDVVDKLAHTIKNLNKIIDMYDDHSYNYGRNSYMKDRYSRRERSYARDRMGRYSRDEAMVGELRDLMENAPDEKTRKEFEKFINKIESM